LALREFGVPARITNPLATLLPLAELAVAVALILTPTARAGAIGALALLLAFMVAIGINLARGRTPDCHCFGQLHSAPAGPTTLARNGVLAAVAALIVWQGAGAGAPAIADWFGGLDATAWGLLVGGVIVALAIVAILRLLLALMQQNGRLLSAFDLLEARLHTVEERLGIDAPLLSEGVVPGGLAVGERAPAFSLASLDGEPSTLEALRAAGKPVVLVFTDPNCGPCTALLPDVSRWQHAHSGRATIVLVSRGSEEANRAKRTEFGVTNVLMQEDREVAEAYRVAGTPSAVLIRPDGTVGSPVAAGADGIRRLVDSIGGTSAPAHGDGVAPRGLAIGEPAPPATLTDLEGDPFELAEYQGAPTAVLFWNPGCGFCQRMLDELKAWEKKPPKRAPQLVVVSAGPVETNREMGLRSPLGLDEGFQLGRAFGAPGTPSAVLLDAEGNVASGVAVGADDVLALLRTSQVPREAALA
jgi:peroxiredoxin